MALFINKVHLCGNLTADPKVSYTPGGTAVANISLAVNRTWFDKQSQEKKTEATFVEVSLFGRNAEVAGEYLAKGKPVYIEGRLKLDQWDDKQTGQKRQKLSVVADTLQLAGSKGDGEQQERKPKEQSAADKFYEDEAPAESFDVDDCPF